MEIAEKVGALALTFDDVLLTPGYSEVLPANVDLKTRLAGNLYLNIPLLSAAMDTVTEARLAIGLARLGGIGVIHRNLSPVEQAEEVDKVKRSEAGMIVDPVTLRPDNTLADAEALMGRYHISGVPITDDGGKLVGILTNRDTRFVEPGPQPVAEFMTSEGLVTAKVGTTLEEAKEILHRHRIEKLPLVDEAGYLKGLITVKDIQKKVNYPMQASDENGRLLCAAAIGVGESGLARLALLVQAGVDVAVIDTAHGHSALVLQTLREAKNRYPNLPIIAGNAATAEGVRDLVQAGADAVKIGIGAGSICTTRVVSGAGMPQLTAVLESAAECRKHDVACIADGALSTAATSLRQWLPGPMQ
jgi:IMP dehydrogenase